GRAFASALKVRESKDGYLEGNGMIAKGSRMSLRLSRYDYASFAAFTAYACCSLVIPVCLVQMGNSLDFPLDAGGMGTGGSLHIARSVAMVCTLLVCALVAGALGKRLTMGVAMLLMGGGVFTCCFAPDAGFLTPCLLVAGLGEGLCEGIATPFVNDLHKDAPATYVNLTHAFWSVGIAVCTILVGFLVAAGVSWRVMLALVGLVTASTAFGFLWRETPRHRYPERRERILLPEVLAQSSRIVHAPRFWVYCLGMFIGSGAEFGLTFWAASFIQLNFGATAFVGGLGTAALAAGMFASRAGFARYLPEKYLPYGLLATSLAGIPCTLLLLALFLIMFCCGFCIGPYWPSLQVYGVRRLPGLDSTLLYIYFSTMGIPGCGFFAWVMGFAGDFVGLRRSLLIVPAAMACYALLIFLEMRHHPRKQTVLRHGQRA
ncbi:MAG: MFS transporter, partial [Victivallales bacterium]|nr:MFS transporter [Victivallales bacterium]